MSKYPNYFRLLSLVTPKVYLHQRCTQRRVCQMRTKHPSSRLTFLSIVLALAVPPGSVRLAQAQPSEKDTVRFLEQSTFGPTPELIARVQQIGFEAFLREQLAAPITDYPELPFWPQTRPTSCTGDCQRDNYIITSSSATSSVTLSPVKTSCVRGSLLP